MQINYVFKLTSVPDGNNFQHTLVMTQPRALTLDWSTNYDYEDQPFSTLFEDIASHLEYEDDDEFR